MLYILIHLTPLIDLSHGLLESIFEYAKDCQYSIMYQVSSEYGFESLGGNGLSGDAAVFE